MKKLILLLLVLGFTANLVSAQTYLDANGEGNTYELINSVLAPAGDVIEVPDCSHESFGRHIDEVYDTTLQMFVFRFHMHVSPDNDRCIKFDRQRNEIKTYDKSPDSLLAHFGETVEYKWKFKLDSNFQSSSSFTHIHQLKSVGSTYDDMPLLTFTTRKSAPDKFELRYAETSTQSTLKKVDLEPFKGTWLEATEIVTFGDPGVISILIKKIDTDEILFEYFSDTEKMWKEGASFIRPKWGLYRSLNDSTNLRDEILHFANFSITETKPLPVEDTIKPTVVLSTNATQPVTKTFECLIKFSEQVRGFVESDISLINGVLESGSLKTTGSILFKVNVLPLTSGIVTINIEAGVVEDLAGNENKAADSLLINADLLNSVNTNQTANWIIYPNPTNSILNITTGNINTNVDLYDECGRIIYTSSLSSKNMSIDLSGFKKGIYLIRLQSDNETVYRKVLLN